jgi:hypothetical protein
MLGPRWEANLFLGDLPPIFSIAPGGPFGGFLVSAAASLISFSFFLAFSTSSSLSFFLKARISSIESSGRPFSLRD